MDANNIQHTDEVNYNIPLNDFETSVENVHNSEIPQLLKNDQEPKTYYLEPCGGILGNLMLAFWKFIGDLRVRHKNIINLSLKSIIMLLVIAYIGYVIKVFIDKGSPVDWCYGYGMAFIILILTLWCIIYYKAIKISCKLMSPYFVRNFGKTIRNIKSRLKTFKITLAVIFIVAFCAFVIYDTRSDPRRLISLFGIVFFILVGLIFSKHPNYIRWDTVVTGVSLHLLIGFLTMKVEAGRNIFQCVGLTIVRFLEYGYNGAEFIFGDFLVNKQHVFAFQSLSVLFFLSMVMQILFHLGWIQVFCFKLGGFLQRLLGTTVIESVNAVSTIFLGMSEAPLLYRPYVKDLTPSEIHCVMTAGFATVAGAFAAIELINAIIACVAASVSMVYFVNGISLWLGSLAGVEGLTIEYLLGKIFIPLAWVMGVRLEQCQDVASLIGLKTFANEFVAYEKLGKLKAAGKLSVRSEAIATFALCGFANPGALATLIALLSSICPLQRSIATKVAFRALAAGSITSFTSACIAGVLTPENGFGS
ncbi:concentrative nucleoside transporter 2 isoform X3 [Rhodnius prolixus]|uniref:concentrative nucleoside transporter 2 isoform X3 n=1 Tax=Rhodnius prolixus TaxID=13249 RepID=UPI003D18B858